MALTESSITGTPLFSTSFVGRDQAIADAKAALSRCCRVLTFVGVGGVGKTRLAVAVVNQLDPTLQAVTSFLPFAAVRDASLVLPTIARDVRARSDNPDLLGSIVQQIGQQRRLLVLDNMEWLTAARTDLQSLLDRCPSLQLLVTSRIPLGIEGEQLQEVEPLPVPRSNGVADPAQIEQNAAVRLFIDRARMSGPDVDVSADDLTAIAAICQRLDGIPLGIELAAARASVLPPKALLLRLTQRLPLLVSNDAAVPDRLRTMRGAISWSYDLLSEPLQALFRRLAVFEGGFSLSSVEALVGGWSPEIGYPFAAGIRVYEHGWQETIAKENPLESDGPWAPPPLEGLEIDVLDGLNTLLAHRLIRRLEPVEGEARYEMLETIREFGREAATVAGDLEAINHAHAAKMLIVAEIAGWGVWGGDRSTWLTRLEAELGNIRAAYAWLATQPTAANQLSLRMADVLWAFWLTRGRVAEGRQYVETALSRPGGSLGARATVTNQSGYFALLQGDDRHAKSVLEANLVRCEEIGFGPFEGSCNLFLAMVAWRNGDLETMNAYLRQGLSRAASANDFITTGIVLILLSILARRNGRFAEAASMLDQATERCAQVGFSWGVATCAYYRGELERARGNHRQAAKWLTEGLRQYHEHDDAVGMAGCLSGLATLAERNSDLERAARLFAAAGKMSEGATAFLPPSEIASYQAAAVSVQDQLGSEEYYRAVAIGYAMPREHLLAEAALVGRKARPAAMRTEVNGNDHAGEKLELTGPQRDVLTLYARGMKVKEIAVELCKSGSTIYDMLGRIKNQYGIESNNELIVFARENGLR